MSSSNYSLSTFTCFARLPTELRIQIWHEALATLRDESPLKLVPYVKRCLWDNSIRLNQLREVQIDERDQQPVLKIGLDHHLLGSVGIEVAMFHVNREARTSVESWVKANSITSCYIEESQRFQIGLNFDPLQDVLLIALDSWNDFYRDSAVMSFNTHLTLGKLKYDARNIKSIAVPDLLLSDSESLESVYRFFPALEVVYVLYWELPNFSLQRSEIMGPRWEMEKAFWPRYCWDPIDECFEVDFENLKGETSSPALSFVPAAIKYLAASLREFPRSKLEIRSRRIKQI